MFPTRERENGLFKEGLSPFQRRSFFEKAVFPFSRGKNRISHGVENRGSLISVPLALRGQESCGPRGPEVAKKNLKKKVFWGVCRKASKNIRKSLKMPKKVREIGILGLFRVFLGDFSADPPKDLF